MARRDEINDLISGCLFLGHLVTMVADGTVGTIQGLFTISEGRGILYQLAARVQGLELTADEESAISRAKQKLFTLLDQTASQALLRELVGALEAFELSEAEILKIAQCRLLLAGDQYSHTTRSN